MSRFSNKCDLWDWLGCIAREPNETPYECYKRLHTELYLQKDMQPILIQKPSDLVPYYPYVDAVHCFERGKSDKHWMCPPQYGEYTGRFYKDALLQEMMRVKVEEDPKYVQTL